MAHDIDSLNIQELTDFISKYEADSHKLALELFPDKPFAYMRGTAEYYHYAKEKLKAMELRLEGKIDEAEVHEEKCSKIYSSMVDDYKW